MSNRLYKRSDQALFSEIGNDVVALHIERGQCYGMENVTAAVWAMLAEPSTIESICARLLDRYEVEPDVCRAEVGKLMMTLQSEGLIEPVGRTVSQ